MTVLNQIKDNTIIVVPSMDYKNNILINISKEAQLRQFKIYTINDFLNTYFYSYNTKAIYYLMVNHNMKYENALIYLKNLCYIENKEYKSKRLNNLVSLKLELIKQGLIICNTDLNRMLKSKNIEFYGFKYIDVFFKNIIKKIPHAHIIEENINSDYNHTIYEFNTVDDEIEFICEEISELSKRNIELNSIKIVSANDEYMISLQRIFDIYKIPLQAELKSNISSTNIGKLFLDNIKPNINETISMIETVYNLEESDSIDIYNKIIFICNKYNWCDDYTSIKDMIKYDMDHTYKKGIILKNAIRLTDNLDLIDDDYVYLVGFNQGVFPITYKDEDFFSDIQKEELGLLSSQKLNSISKDTAIDNIRKIKNLTISYSLNGKNGFSECSTINDELKYKVVTYDNKCSHSNLINKINLIKGIDLFVKYGLKSDYLIHLYNTYKNYSYMSYDNRFKGIDILEMRKYKDNKLTLSYSSLDEYFRCSFRYYVSHILKINVFEETFMTYIGSLFHAVLSNCYAKDFNFDVCWNNFMVENYRNFSNKEKFFLKKLKEELKYIIKTLYVQKEYTTFDKSLYENNVEIKIDNEMNVKFIGFIDKILYKQNDNETLAAIVDYKTGNPLLSLNNIPYGIGMQLPIYLYLASKYSKLNNPKIVGFYLQKILHSEIMRDENKSYSKQKMDQLKLQGYSVSNENILSQFDKTYVDSQLIKSMKLGRNGFYAYSKILSETNINSIIEMVEKKVIESASDISNAKFDINPKKIGLNNLGCEYCKYKDICFMTPKDIEYKEEYKDLKFLGGDI